MKRIIISLLLMSVLSCTEEPLSSEKATLIAQWNSYESGTEQFGFTEYITNSLLLSYESGVHFNEDGTFGARYFTPDSGAWDFFTIEEPGTWTNSGIKGNYTLKGNTIILTYFPGTTDESTHELEVIKLDEHHLWFKHNLFGSEIEHHLVRDN